MKTFCLLFLFLLANINANSQTNSATEVLEAANKLISKKKFTEAFDLLAEGIDQMPDSITLYAFRGTLFDAFMLYDSAIEDFTTALSLAEDDSWKANLFANRGGMKSKIRDFEGAYIDLDKAIELDPENLAALNNMAMVCEEIGKAEEALTYLLEVVKVDPDFAPAYVNIGFTFQGMGKHKKAIEFFDKAVVLSPEEPLAYSNRAFSKLKVNDLKGAMKDINKSIKMYEINSYAYKIRALIYIEKKDLEKACEDLSEAQKLHYRSQYGDEVYELKTKYCQ